MGRDITADKTPLLMNAEQNIGNSAIVQPEVGIATTFPATNPQRLILLSGGSAVGQSTSVVVTAARLPLNVNPKPGIPGPITGIIEFGNGGRSTKLEFDVQIGPFVGKTLAVAAASNPQDGMTIVTVPTGVLRVYTRYDNLLIAPLLETTPQTVGGQAMLADVQGVPRLGPGGPVDFGAPLNLIPAEPVLTQAMAAYFTRHYSTTYKTLYLYMGQPTGGGPQPALVSAAPAPGLSAAQYVLPAFSRSLRVLRVPTAALTVTIFNSYRSVERYQIPAGSVSPTIPIVGNESIISIISDTVADTVTFLALVCEVGI